MGPQLTVKQLRLAIRSGVVAMVTLLRLRKMGLTLQ